MPERFFVDDGAVSRAGVVIEGPLARHIAAALRMRAGDDVVVVDRAGQEHGVSLRRSTPARVEGEVTWTRPATGEPRLRVTVVQALPRDRMEDCIDVLVESGVAEVRPVYTERTITRPPEQRLANRVHRWQATATEAAQLAGRGMIPPVHAPVDLQDALAALAPGSRIVACTFDGVASLAGMSVTSERPLAVCIGPEGGFGDRDLDALRRVGAERVHMGARVLRTRYAGGVACALLLARAGDLAEPMRRAPRR